MSAWKSRWSWVRLVKTATSKWIASARCRTSACEETSIAQARSPPSSIRRKVACRSIASGVVRSTASSTPPTTCLTVPSSPHWMPGRLEDLADQEGGRRLAVGAGDPDDPQLRASDRRRSAPRPAPSPPARRRPRPAARRASSSRSTTSAAAPASTTCGANSCPSALLPGHAEEQRPGPRLAAVVGEIGDLDAPGRPRSGRPRRAATSSPSLIARRF